MDWQFGIAAIVIALAVCHVSREVYRFLSPKQDGTCGGCAACPSGNAIEESQQFVSLEFKTATNRQSK